MAWKCKYCGATSKDKGSCNNEIEDWRWKHLVYHVLSEYASLAYGIKRSKSIPVGVRKLFDKVEEAYSYMREYERP